MTRRLRILHLAYQDHLQPGSGGGAVRTLEINRRLAERHDITVVAAGWPGARERVEGGVRYRHAGRGRTRLRALTYFASIPWQVRRASVDLVVDDFGAPIGSVGPTRFTGVPVVAMVQWLFAQEMSTKYHLPLRWAEDAGLRSHADFICVSQGLADDVAIRRPGARVHVVPNGVEPVAFEVVGDPGRFGDPAAPVVFLGRLDIGQKGLDVLLDAMSLLPDEVRVVIAGDGPDERRLRSRAAALRVGHRIDWAGRVSGQAKYELLARAGQVVVPSRYETFGMVAAEGLAAGAAVVATDIPCLREVVPDGVGRRVPPDDAAALAQEIALLRSRPDLAEQLSRNGRSAARQYDWDALAAAQEAVYHEVVRRATR